MPEFYSPEDHIERNPNSQDWTETTGFQTTIEITGPLPVLEQKRDDAVRCGYTESSLSQTSPGSAMWVLRLTFIGKNAPESVLFQPEPEEQSTHWTFRPNYENLDLWRHPTYAPLIACEIRFGKRVFKQTDENYNNLAQLGILVRSEDGDTELPINEATIDETTRENIGFYDSNGIWNWVNLTPLVYEGVNEDEFPEDTYASFKTSLKFPYSGLIQSSALSWRRNLERRIQESVDHIMRNLPEVAQERIKLQTSGVQSFINLTQEFDIRKHLATKLPSGVYHAYSVVPVRTLSDPDNKIWSQEGLLDLAQSFADEILARREKYPYDRQTIVNERVVSIRSGMNANYVGVNEIWTSDHIARTIEHQIEQREALLEDRPSECQDRHKTMEEMINILHGKLQNRLWLKKAPRSRTSSRGRLEITQEWEERLPWEINGRINPPYVGPLYYGDPFSELPQIPPGGDPVIR